MSIYMSDYDPWSDHDPAETYDVPMMNDSTHSRSGTQVKYPKQSGHRCARVWTGATAPGQFSDEGEQITGDIPQVGDLWFDKANNAMHVRVEGGWVDLTTP